MYKQSVRKIIDFKILDDTIVVSTDNGLISFKSSKADEELNQFLPAEGETPPAPTGLIKFGEDPKWNNLKTTIYGMIDKLNTAEGSKFVDQAKSITDSAKTLVEMMKVEVEVARIVRK